MLAIYQANPSAFEKNMNLLRSGAVLRIPESSDATAISPTEANGEIRRQYAAWRSTARRRSSRLPTEPGHLRLVTPTGSDSPRHRRTSTAETKALQGRVKDLEGQLSESKRLLEMRNAELARLQSQIEGQGKARRGCDSSAGSSGCCDTATGRSSDARSSPSRSLRSVRGANCLCHAASGGRACSGSRADTDTACRGRRCRARADLIRLRLRRPTRAAALSTRSRTTGGRLL